MLSTGQHTLTTQPDSDDSYKHCILVKLTDSSAKAIEEYLKNKDNTNKKPSIMFHKDKGEICFPIESNTKPSLNAGLSNDSPIFQYKKFHFCLSSVKESNKDTSASFECISYANSKLKTMASIEQKLTVQAINDEVFQATKEKVNSVAEAEKNNSTIEIKPSGAIVSRSASAAANLNNQNINRNKQNNVSSSNAKPNPALNISDSSKPKSLVTDKTLKERVIHLLAIKPYKKPEIFLKLNKENPLNDKEKEMLEPTLQSVATINPKNNQFDLLNEIMLSDVKEDWPTYNQNDKQIVKRNIAKAKQSFGNNSFNTSLNTSSNPARPSSSLSSSFNTTPVNKQSSAFVSIPPSSSNLKEELKYAGEGLAKKLSPVKSDNNGKASAPFHNGFNSSINNNFKSKVSSLSPPGDASSENFDLITNKKPLDSDFDMQTNTNKRLKTNTNGMNIKQNDQITARMDINEQNEFSKKYKPIINNQQYKEYKEHFDFNYKEYKDLYNYLIPISKQFETYRLEMEALTDQTSKEYVEKKRKIFLDFQAKKSDIDYCRKRDRYEYLDKKLSFLNELFEKYSHGY